MSVSEKPLVELFVQASSTDKTEKGPCLTSQQWFMILYSLVERGLIDLRLTPMTHDCPPKSYTDLNAARYLPIAWIQSGTISGYERSDKAIASWDEMELLMNELGYPYLNPSLSETDVRQAEQVFEDLMSNLMQLIRLGKAKPLLNTLEKIDNFLASKNQRFLLGPELSYPDCLLMPKLQHVRVLCQTHKNSDIPEHFKHLCRYVGEMYRSEAFIRSCPSDRDIILHYMEKDALKKNFRLRLLGSESLNDVPGSTRKAEPLVNGSTLR
ncbi:Chloride intracellular channel exc-4 [Fasciola gigantica]|uniref:Chloride intracellular channel exc-4 n=1 Tax=Fasciola gigantica TaxID=46835 RepID=A0A504YA87_FASGI|nr:Chloride intracellular channel exc-4 [Fasciola gigantica]